jgi:hypothetical protein
MALSERWLWGAAAGLAVVVAALFVFRMQQSDTQLPVVTAAIPPCDLQQGPCSVVIEGLGPVTLTIAPRPIPLVEPLAFSVDAGLPDVRSVAVDFSGVDMNMGYNRFVLPAAGSNRYEGEGMLPVCVRNRMTWEAKVMIETTNLMYVVPFRFDTVARR